MDPQLKQRLVGAIVLITLAVIIIPGILDQRPQTNTDDAVTSFEISPEPEEKFSSQVIPLDGDQSRALIPIEKQPRSVIKPAEREIAKQEKPEPKTGIISWTVQVAVLSSEKSAKDLVKKLSSKGFQASYDKSYGNSGARYRVRVGPVYSEIDAAKLKKNLDHETGLKGLIVRYP